MDLVLSVLILIAVQLLSFLVLRGRIHQELNATTLLKDVRDEVDGMVRELNLSAERNIGLLEARIEEMEGLLAEADQKVVLLTRELDRRDKAAETYSQLKRVVAEAPPEPAPQPAAPTQTAPAPVSPPVAAPPASEGERRRSLTERVLSYRELGADAAAIAAATGATRAEVELILSLHPRP